MEGSPIQWCDDTANPTMGCDGCELWAPDRKSCYAGILHEARGGKVAGYARAFSEVTVFPGRMAAVARRKSLQGLRRPDKPWLDGSPRLIFVSDMSDALSATVTFEYLEMEVINVVSDMYGRRHRWLWLTKRPGRMAKFSSWLRRQGVAWPTNLWVGTSITTSASRARIDDLLAVGNDTTVRFLSVEPQVEPIDITGWLGELDWIIQGGESGRDARPFHLEWASELLSACKVSRTPYFLKQLGAEVYSQGKALRIRDGHGGDWLEWPPRFRVREVPTLRKRGLRPEVFHKAYT